MYEANSREYHVTDPAIALLSRPAAFRFLFARVRMSGSGLARLSLGSLALVGLLSAQTPAK
jgi:hypothetical protein